jgi:hypothetical protein
LSLNRRGVLGTAAALAVAGCSPVTVLNTLAPSRLVADGVAYGEGERRKLDIYAPAGAGPFPVLVFLYGGAWDSGSRAIYRFLGGAFASHGLVTVIPDYRLYPEVKFPSFLQDCAAAVRWTRDNIGRYGGAAGPFFLMGHSAGAYNAAMLGLDGEWLGQVGMARADLRGVIGVSGPYDFVPDTDALRDIFGPPDHYPQTQPINFVDGHSRHYREAWQHHPPGGPHPREGRLRGGALLRGHRPHRDHRRGRHPAALPGTDPARQPGVHGAPLVYEERWVNAAPSNPSGSTPRGRIRSYGATGR